MVFKKNRKNVKKQAPVLAVFAFILFFCIFIPIKTNAFSDVVVNDIAFYADPDWSSGNTFNSDYVIGDAQEYDFVIFNCISGGNRTSMTLSDITFGDFSGDIDYLVDNRNSSETNIIIIVKGRPESGTSTLYFTMSESPSGTKCDMSAFDLNYDIDDNIEAYQYYSQSETLTTPTIPYNGNNENDMLFFSGGDCSSCGSLDMTYPADWSPITSRTFQGFIYNTEPNSPNDSLAITGSTPLGTWYNHGFSIRLKEETVIIGEGQELPEYQFYTSGDYVIPKQIKCYWATSYCEMVFGYGVGAFSRSITEADPADQEYPNYSFYWPDLLSDPIATNTLRTHIDQGQQYYISFAFPTPTSTTDYWLEIQDPGDQDIGSSTSFQIEALLISTTTADIMSTCLGTCEEGLLGEIFCGLKKTACFLIVPQSDSVLFVKSGFEQLKTKFPFNLFTELTTAVQSGIDKEDDRTGFIPIPMIRQTATGTEYYMLPVISSTSMPNLLGQDNTNTFRTTIVYFLWIIDVSILVIFLISRQKH